MRNGEIKDWPLWLAVLTKWRLVAICIKYHRDTYPEFIMHRIHQLKGEILSNHQQVKAE
jgi:hypothetical protein